VIRRTSDTFRARFTRCLQAPPLEGRLRSGLYPSEGRLPGTPGQKTAEIRGHDGGLRLAIGNAMSWETRIGRSLAFGVHPRAAWPRLTRTSRALLVTGYAVASYVLVLVLLLLFLN